MKSHVADFLLSQFYSRLSFISRVGFEGKIIKIWMGTEPKSQKYMLRPHTYVHCRTISIQQPQTLSILPASITRIKKQFSSTFLFKLWTEKKLRFFPCLSWQIIHWIQFSCHKKLIMLHKANNNRSNVVGI